MFRLLRIADPAFLVNLDPVPEPDPWFWWPKIEMGPELSLFTNSDLASINKVKTKKDAMSLSTLKVMPGRAPYIYPNESIKNLVQANLYVVLPSP